LLATQGLDALGHSKLPAKNNIVDARAKDRHRAPQLLFRQMPTCHKERAP